MILTLGANAMLVVVALVGVLMKMF